MTLPSRRLVLQGLAATLAASPAVAQAPEAEQQAAPAPTPPTTTPPAATPPAAPATRILKAAPSTHRLLPEPAPETPVLAFDGAIPGPTLRTKRGEPFAIRFANGLDQPTSLHWHGVRGPNAMDGVAGLTQEPIAPGAAQDIAFTPPDAGLFWYRPMLPARAAEQTARGLYGLFIVDEPSPPPVDHDLPLVLTDWALGDDGHLSGAFDDPAAIAGAGRLGNALTVNGKPAPDVLKTIPGARLRLRVLNASSARPFTLRFDQVTARIIAVDGQPTEPFAPSRGQASLIPGARLDIMLDAPDRPGMIGNVIAALGAGLPLLRIETDGAPSPLAGSPIVPLPDHALPPSIELEHATRLDLVLAGGLDPAKLAAGAKPVVPDPARVWTINGVSWPDAGEKPLFSVKRGTPVTLGLINRTTYVQGLHVHGHCVRLLHALDDGWEPYWLETVPIAPGATARIAFIADNPGRWMIGSSFVDRLSSGLAGWFEVKGG